MKRFVLFSFFFFFLKGFVQASLMPSSILNINTATSLIFDKMNIYLDRVFKDSDIRYLSPHCRQLQFYKKRSRLRKTNINICINRVASSGGLKETIDYKINGRDAGRYSIIRRGRNIKPYEDLSLMKMNFAKIKEGSYFYFILEDLDLNIITRQDKNFFLSMITFPYSYYAFSIRDAKSISHRIRTISSSCQACGDPVTLQVVANKGKNSWIDVELSYYTHELTGRITPRFFNSELNSRVISAFPKIGKEILDRFQSKFNWPSY